MTLPRLLTSLTGGAPLVLAYDPDEPRDEHGRWVKTIQADLKKSNIRAKVENSMGQLIIRPSKKHSVSDTRAALERAGWEHKTTDVKYGGHSADAIYEKGEHQLNVSSSFNSHGIYHRKKSK